MVRRFCYILLSIFSINSGFSQSSLSYDWVKDIDVFEGTDKINMPWTGGFNSVQINSMDFTGDGIEDLVIYERFSGMLKPLEATADGWSYRPEYINYFPPAGDWFLLRDLNNDGKKDVVTSHPIGMRVYINTSLLGSEKPTFRPMNEGRELLTQGLLGAVNITLNPDDIPAIEDVNGDGLLDILSFGFLSNSIEYNMNVSTPDSVIFEKVSSNWGDFEECSCGLFAFGQTCEELLGGRIEHSGAKGLFLVDNNGDGKKELLISEDNCSVMFMLENINTIEDPVMRNPTDLFPNVEDAVYLYVYPAAYFEDIDHDGDRDLLITTNSRTNVGLFMNYAQTIFFYENIGTDSDPNFKLIENDFLQNATLDFGENASPLFYDFDSDGDEDLLVGRWGEFNSGRRGSIYRYENIGDGLAPVFSLVTDDWLGLSTLNLSNIKPQLVDINNDKDIDLVFTASLSNEFGIRSYFIQNDDYWELSFGGKFINDLGLNLGLSENIYFSDIDLDEDVDILVSRNDGTVELYERMGESFAAKGIFYGLDYNPLRGAVSLLVDDLDGNGINDLLMGTKSGKLEFFRDFQSDISSPIESESVDFYIGDESLNSDFVAGTSVRPVVARIFNEDLPSIGVGTGEGGLLLFKNRLGIAGPLKEKYSFYPNLINTGSGQGNIISTQQNIAVEYLTLNGQSLSPLIKVPANSSLDHSLIDLASGLYLLRIYTSRDQFDTKKIVIIR